MTPSPWEAEAGGSEIESHSQLHVTLEASLGYMRLCLKNERRNAIRKASAIFQ